MAKKKDISIRELLVKLCNIFPSDMYIIYGRYIIEGPKSKEQNCGYYSACFNEDCSKVFLETFSKKDIIYFSDTKKAKDELEKYTSIVTDEEKIKEILKDSNTYIHKLKKNEKWNKFNLSDKEIEDIFEGNEVEIVIDEKTDQKMMLSKSLLPLVNKTTFLDLYYHTKRFEMEDDKNEIIQLILSFDHEYFQFYMTYNILVL